MRVKVPYRFGVLVPVFPTTGGGYDWEGLSTATQPILDYILPESPIAAEEMTWVLKSTTQDAYDQYIRQSLLVAATWLENSVSPSADTTKLNKAAAWDAKNNRWWFHTTAGAGVAYFTTDDGGRTFVAVSTTGQPTGPSSTLAVRPSDGTVFVPAAGSATGITGNGWTYLNGTWTSHAGVSPGGAGHCVVWFAAASKFVDFSTVPTTPFHAIVATSPDGATWTDRSSTANFADGFGGTTTPKFGFAAQSASTLAAFSPVTSFGTYNTTTDGTTWTSRISPVLTGEAVMSADYDTDNGLFVLLVSDGSTTSRCLTSPDAITWTANAMPLSSGATLSGLACMGTLYVASAQGVVSGGGVARSLLSTDKGVTWRPAALTIANSVNAGAVERIYSNGTGLVAWNTTYASFSVDPGM